LLEYSENRSSETPLIALDFSTFDHLSVCNGQYRYCLNLIRGLVELDPRINFVLLGSRSNPGFEIAGVISKNKKQWRYRQIVHHHGRGRYWRDQLMYSLTLRRLGVQLYHALDGLMRIVSPCPVVVTQYDLMVELFSEYRKVRCSLAYLVNRWMVAHVARRVICISQSTATDLCELWKARRERVDVIALGSEYVDVFSKSNTEEKTATRKVHEGSIAVLLSPYNLEPRKNLHTLLRAAARLRVRYADLRLVLFGRAAVTVERERIFDHSVRELGLENMVAQTGTLDDVALRHLYQQCTLFIFPSLYEGFGLPLLEAMACGACVVARNTSAMREVVGEAGALVETSNFAVLADEIARLLEAPQRIERLRVAARERASLFTVERMARSTYRSYCTALGMKSDNFNSGRNKEQQCLARLDKGRES
jgi:glycosyltransferase involved in cell wall biosynthesis